MKRRSRQPLSLWPRSDVGNEVWLPAALVTCGLGMNPPLLVLLSSAPKHMKHSLCFSPWHSKRDQGALHATKQPERQLGPDNPQSCLHGTLGVTDFWHHLPVQSKLWLCSQVWSAGVSLLLCQVLLCCTSQAAGKGFIRGSLASCMGSSCGDGRGMQPLGWQGLWWWQPGRHGQPKQQPPWLCQLTSRQVTKRS